MQEKIMYLDLETGGVDPKRSAILQLSAGVEIDGQVVDSFEIFMKPFPGDEVEDGALDHNHITRADIETDQFVDSVYGYTNFLDFMSKYVNKMDRNDKFSLIGFGVEAFDEQFLRQWFIKNGETKYFNSWFHNPSIDLKTLAAYTLRKHRHKLGRFRLVDVCHYMGIEVDESQAHNSTYDIGLCYHVYHQCNILLLQENVPSVKSDTN